jgi:hypothetical protein
MYHVADGMETILIFAEFEVPIAVVMTITPYGPSTDVSEEHMTSILGVEE